VSTFLKSVAFGAALLSLATPISAQANEVDLDALSKSVLFLVCPLAEDVEILAFDKSPDGSRGKLWTGEGTRTFEDRHGALVFEGLYGIYVLSGDELVVVGRKGAVQRSRCTDHTRWVLTISEAARSRLRNQ